MKSTRKLLASYAVFAGIFVMVCGVAVANWMSASNALEPEPRHPITEELRKQTAAQAGQAIPYFVRKNVDGEVFDLKQAVEKGPVFVIFIMEGCPCSYEAQPLFQRIEAAFGKKVQFVGITTGSVSEAKEWKAHFDMAYPVISEPDAKLMHDFKAVHSAYTALLTKEGGVVSMWPGYSQHELQSITEALNRATGLREIVAVTDAPRKPTTGCTF